MNLFQKITRSVEGSCIATASFDGESKPKKKKVKEKVTTEGGIIIFCNYCSFPHEIFTGKTPCPQCKKPAGVRPQEWACDKTLKLWDARKA